MIKYKEIKGAKELVESYRKDLKVIKKSLAELEKRKTVLEEKIGNSSDRFTLDSIEKNAKTKHELNLVKQYIAEAQNQKEQLNKEHQKNALKDVVSLLKTHKQENTYKHNDINKAMVEHLYAIRALYQKYQEIEKNEQEKVNAFILDLLPFLPETDRNGNPLNEYAYINDIKRQAFNSSKEIFHKLPETVYGVKGAVELDKDIYFNRAAKQVTPNVLDRRYKVDHEKATQQH